MKKRGFTLIEIIISISLIAIIGTISIVSIISLRKAKVENLLESNSKVLNNALEVYLEKHPEVTNNVNNNFKGAVVTLQVLKDEGLIDIKGLSDKNYKENYYFLSNSVLADGNKVDESKCENNILSLQTVTSWNLNNLNPEQIIYICPTSGSGNTTTDLVNVKNYVAKGENPNNYVELSVKSDNTQWAWWPYDSSTNLWRIVSIEDGKIKLMYNKTVGSDNTYNYAGKIKEACRYNDKSTNYVAKLKTEIDDSGYCNLIYNCYGVGDDGGRNYFRYGSNNGSKNLWSSSEVVSDFSKDNMSNTPNACFVKKEALYNNIDENIRNYIIKYNYYQINVVDESTKKTFVKNLEMFLGFLTDKDYDNSLYNGKTWLADSKDNIWKNFDPFYKAQYDGEGTEPGMSTYKFYTIYGHEYQPVITLSEKIKLKKNNNDNCLDVNGTLNCPYQLQVTK